MAIHKLNESPRKKSSVDYDFMSSHELNRRKRGREGKELPDDVKQVLQDMIVGELDYNDIRGRKFTMPEIEKLRQLVSPVINDPNLSDSNYESIVDEVVSVLKGAQESLKESFIDKKITFDEIQDAINDLQDLADQMSAENITEINGLEDNKSYRLVRFPGGCIDLEDVTAGLASLDMASDFDESLKEVYSPSLEDKIANKIASEVLPELTRPDDWDVLVTIETGDEGQKICTVDVEYSGEGYGDGKPDRVDLDELGEGLESALFNYMDGESLRIDDTSGSGISAYFDLVAGTE